MSPISETIRPSMDKKLQVEHDSMCSKDSFEHMKGIPPRPLFQCCAHDTISADLQLFVLFATHSAFLRSVQSHKSTPTLKKGAGGNCIFLEERIIPNLQLFVHRPYQAHYVPPDSRGVLGPDNLTGSP